MIEIRRPPLRRAVKCFDIFKRHVTLAVQSDEIGLKRATWHDEGSFRGRCSSFWSVLEYSPVMRRVERHNMPIGRPHSRTGSRGGTVPRFAIGVPPAVFAR